MSGPKPLTRQRSAWEEFRHMDAILDAPVSWFRRRTNDGTLIAAVSEEPHGWHMSISFRDHRREPTRYPSYDEQVHALRELMPTDRTFVMIVPPDDQYVALHDSTFHWHELTEHTWEQR